MKKISIVIAFLILLIVPFSVKADEFNDEVKDAYEVYIELYNFKTPNYELRVIKGIANDTPSYGIYFFSEEANKYQLVLESKDKEYNIKSFNNRGDIKALAIKEINISYILKIYSNGKEQHLGEDVTIKPFTEGEFLSNNNLIKGNDKGCKVTNLSNVSEFKIEYLMVGSSFVILGCVLIIYVFAKMKKGKFDKEKRKEGVFDFKEFITREIEEKEINEFEIINIEAEKEEKEEETVREIYSKVGRYDEDEKSNFSIETYLQDKGFVTNYKIASEDEKRSIMLELMRLRDEAKITNDEYLEEAYRLWKE